MRVLTVRQPWAWAIIHGGKDVENRVRNIAGDYRGPVAIHVARGLGSYNETEAALQAVHLVTGQDVRRVVRVGTQHGGRIIGVVDLVDAHPVENCIEQQRDGDWLVCSEWAERAGHHLVLANPRPLATPIPFKGALGLRRLDADTIALIERGLS